jgi:hypothetical protein
MYRIEKKPYGYRMLFSGFIKNDEMKAWAQEVKATLAAPQAKEFGVFVDMRDLKPLDDAAKATMVEGQLIFKDKGMVRSVVILNSPILTMQFKRLAKESGIYQWERYVDASVVSDFEKVGEDWVGKGIDPDKK